MGNPPSIIPVLYLIPGPSQLSELSFTREKVLQSSHLAPRFLYSDRGLSIYDEITKTEVRSSALKRAGLQPVLTSESSGMLSTGLLPFLL